MSDTDLLDEGKDMSYLLNALNSGVDPFSQPVRHKRKLLPHPEGIFQFIFILFSLVEKGVNNELKRIKLVFPVGKAQLPESSVSSPSLSLIFNQGLVVSDTGEIFSERTWVDTMKLANDLAEFMKTCKVTQTQLSRYFGV